MRATKQAVQVILAMQKPGVTPVGPTHTQWLECEGGHQVPLDVYEPAARYRGTIVVVHGMTIEGHRDDRIISLAHSLTRGGFRVAAPNLSCIQALQISDRQIGHIAQVVEAILAERALCPTGRVSLLAPSFSGSLSLSAACQPSINRHVDAVCAIGAFGQVESVMQFLLADDEADPYGRYIVLKKLLPATTDASRKYLFDALDAAIHDNIQASRVLRQPAAFSGAPERLSTALSGMSADERSHVEKLLGDKHLRLKVLEEATPALSEEFRMLNVATHLENLEARVFLLHGSGDRVIPSQQSEQLSHQIRHHNKAGSLLVSPLLSHADTALNLKLLGDVWRMVNGFAYYFRHVGGYRNGGRV